MTAASRSRTPRKVLGSLAVIGAAAAVAGMGTFGTFTDSTAPLGASPFTLRHAGHQPRPPVTPPARWRSARPASRAGRNPISRSVTADERRHQRPRFDHALLGVHSPRHPAHQRPGRTVCSWPSTPCSVAWTRTTNATGGAVYTCSGTKKAVAPASSPAVQAATPPVTGLDSMAAKAADYLVVTALAAHPGGQLVPEPCPTTLSACPSPGTQQTGTNR